MTSFAVRINTNLISCLYTSVEHKYCTTTYFHPLQYQAPQYGHRSVSDTDVTKGLRLFGTW
jgi:hypothetical protein